MSFRSRARRTRASGGRCDGWWTLDEGRTASLVGCCVIALPSPSTNNKRRPPQVAWWWLTMTCQETRTRCDLDEGSTVVSHQPISQFDGALVSAILTPPACPARPCSRPPPASAPRSINRSGVCVCVCSSYFFFCARVTTLPPGWWLLMCISILFLSRVAFAHGTNKPPRTARNCP
ncbi:hypothetical protein B0T17DRAFT_66543 [Bombardia bombarda]|uniref:Uncharacterized protein n=1 Tax=Bombardia bombarda TaxID=252184 RepID=A0AA40CEZ4_9PEZI|nr:hypothetical protein B0T17DRAFT_66543 [Bombardia bombarda]